MNRGLGRYVHGRNKYLSCTRVRKVHVPRGGGGRWAVWRVIMCVCAIWTKLVTHLDSQPRFSDLMLGSGFIPLVHGLERRKCSTIGISFVQYRVSAISGEHCRRADRLFSKASGTERARRKPLMYSACTPGRERLRYHDYNSPVAVEISNQGILFSNVFRQAASYCRKRARCLASNLTKQRSHGRSYDGFAPAGLEAVDRRQLVPLACDKPRRQGHLGVMAMVRARKL